MNFEECFEHWEETGDTHFECFVGENHIEMFITNDVGEFYKYKLNGVDCVSNDIAEMANVWSNDFYDWTRW
jgi:hypothetical protein